MEDAKLVVVGGDTKYNEVALHFPMVIGRGKECDVVLPHPLVSRRHCEILSSDTSLKVRDLGSLNGTFVGRERITERELRPGELLTIGTVTFRVIYGSWTEDESHVLPEIDNMAIDTVELSADQTKFKAGKDDTQNANDGSAFVAQAGDQIGA